MVGILPLGLRDQMLIMKDRVIFNPFLKIIDQIIDSISACTLRCPQKETELYNSAQVETYV